MDNKIKFILITKTFLLTLIFATGLTHSQVNYESVQKWKWLHPQPQGNSLFWCKAWDNNNWYMCGWNGIFLKTSDAGLTWSVFYNVTRTGSQIFDMPRGDFMDAHFFNQNTGLLISSYGGIYKTTNAGSNLVTFDSISGLPVRSTWRHIYFSNSNTGYISGVNGKLIKTTNAGNNWTLISSISSSDHQDVWTPDDTLIIVCSADGKIERSNNSGINWTTHNTGTTSYLQKILFLNKDTGIVCGQQNTVILTTNGGINWININSGLASNSNYTDLDYRINSGNIEIFLTGNAQNIYKTTNLGSTWDTIGILAPNQQNMGLFQRYFSTAFLGGDTLLTVGAFGLINKISSSSDRNLFTSFVKYGGAEISDIWAQNGKILAVGEPTTIGTTFDHVLYSSNDGNSWIAANTGNFSGSMNSISMPDENTGYIAGTNGKVMKTVDGGLTWGSVAYPNTSEFLNKVEFVNENTGWVFGDNTSYKTTDGGTNWLSVTLPVNVFWGFDADMLDENTGWFTGGHIDFPVLSTFIYKTTNGGLNWSQQYFYSPLRSLLSIKMCNNNTGYAGGYNTFLKTTNSGGQWDSIPLPLIDYQITGIDFITPESGILLSNAYTMKTNNGGISWDIDYLGSLAGWNNSPSRIKMLPDGSAYYGGISANILKYDSGVIGITNWENTVPEKYELYQNYPNPFNPSTTIKFALPKSGNVSLKVYDITGREVRTIINNMQLNSGTITHNFDGSELASGIYFYSLMIDGNLIDTKKMVLVK